MIGKRKRKKYLKAVIEANKQIIAWNKKLKPFAENLDGIDGFSDTEATVNESHPRLIHVTFKSKLQPLKVKGQVQELMSRKYGIPRADLYCNKGQRSPESYLILLDVKRWEEEFQALLNLAKKVK